MVGRNATFRASSVKNFSPPPKNLPAPTPMGEVEEIQMFPLVLSAIKGRRWGDGRARRTSTRMLEFTFG